MALNNWRNFFSFHFSFPKKKKTIIFLFLDKDIFFILSETPLSFSRPLSLSFSLSLLPPPLSLSQPHRLNFLILSNLGLPFLLSDTFSTFQG